MQWNLYTVEWDK